MVLLFVDGRFPGGSFQHSSGLEEAVRRGWVHDLRSLGSYVDGLTRTSWRTQAALAAAAARDPAAVAHLDLAAEARIVTATQRRISRSLGRHLARAAGAFGAAGAHWGAWACTHYPNGLHQPVAIGCLLGSLGVEPEAAAFAVLFQGVLGVVSAGIRLVGFDPVGAMGLVGDRVKELAEIAGDAADPALSTSWDLPRESALLHDYLIEVHDRREGRLFAS